MIGLVLTGMLVMLVLIIILLEQLPELPRRGYNDRPQTPKPQILPPSQIPHIPADQRRQFEQNFSESIARIQPKRSYDCVLLIGCQRTEPDIEDEP